MLDRVKSISALSTHPAVKGLNRTSSTKKQKTELIELETGMIIMTIIIAISVSIIVVVFGGDGVVQRKVRASNPPLKVNKLA